MGNRPARPLRQGANLRERGSATVEYAAVLALAALLAVSVVVSVRSADLGPTVTTAYCRVRSALALGGPCGPGESTGPTPPDRPPFDPKPAKCKVGEHGEKVNGVVKIAFVQLGQNAGFVETTYSDDSVTFTATDGASVGLTGGFGTKLDVGKVERGAKVDFGGDFKVDYGSTWTFKDAAEAEAMRKQLGDYLGEQAMIKQNPNYAIRFLFTDAKEPPKPPSQRVSTMEVSDDVGGKIGLGLPFKTDPTAESGIPSLTLVDAGVKFGGSHKWTRVIDTTTGATTYTTGGEEFDQMNGTLGPVSGEHRRTTGSSLAVTRDKDNQVTKVALVTTREGKATGSTNAGQGNLGGKVSDTDGRSSQTVTTTSLDVSTPEQRRVVDAWLAQQHSNPLALVPTETYDPRRAVPDDPFQNLMFTNGQVSNVQYDNVTDKQGFALDVKLGVALGVDFSLETNDSKAAVATYLGVPDGAGTRVPVDFPECLGR